VQRDCPTPLIAFSYDCRLEPLIERKQALRKLLAKAPEALVYVEHLEIYGVLNQSFAGFEP
jgi:hypothetical protein